MAISKMLEAFHKYFGVRSEFSENDYLHEFGKASNCLLYSVLFLPDLIEIETIVFLKRNVYDESVLRSELIKHLDSKKDTPFELKYNYVEVGYLFSPGGRDTTDEEDELLACRIRDSWEGWLKIKYPNRKFNIEILTPEETGSTVGVQFYEVRS